MILNWLIYICISEFSWLEVKVRAINGYYNSYDKEIEIIVLDVNENNSSSSVVNEADGISIYPNPVKDYLIVKNSGKEQIKEVILLDLKGTEILKIEQPDYIDLSALSPAMYNLLIKTENKTLSQRIIVQ